jgi:hypothetical protein
MVKGLPNFSTTEVDSCAVVDGVVKFRLPQALSAPKGSQPLNRSIRAVTTEAHTSQVASRVVSLKEAIQIVNEHKREMGDALVLSIQEDGTLKALMELV